MMRILPLSAAALVLAACGDLCSAERLPRCDIRDEACHAQVQAVVRCMRGESASSLPSIQVITLEELEAYLRAGADPMMMRSLEWETSLELLGLLDPSVDLYEGSITGALASLAALYSPPERAVFVIDRGMPMDSVEAVSTLAHELVHAAQDEQHDLDALLDAASTHEEVMVLKSTVEGEAQLYTFEAQAWDLGAGLDELHWPAFYDEWIGDLSASLQASGSPYFAVYGQLPYALGARWQTARWQSGGDAAVQAGIATPPESSAWLLVDPWGAVRVPPLRVSEPRCDPPPPPAGFEASMRDEMGAPLVFAFLQRWGMTRAEAWDLALRWRRDDLFVYVAPDGRAALAWRIMFGDAQAPRWTATHLENTAPARFREGYTEDTVLILSASDHAVVEAWTWDGPTDCAPPR